MKYQFLGKPNKIYNFPSLKLYGITVENFNDYIGEILFKAGKDIVKEAKVAKKEA